MRIVKLMGGLGNQMFQYSFAKFIEKLTGDLVKIDTSYFANTGNDSIRKPRIYQFNLSLQTATAEDVSKLCYLSHNSSPYKMRHYIAIDLESIINREYIVERSRAYIAPDKLKKYYFFDGYWQSWRYIYEVLESIKKEFIPSKPLNPKTTAMINQVREENSVFVGVRRGDYSTNSSHYGFFDQDYYDQAMQYISDRVANPVFYIFSNNINWVMENMKFQKWNVVFRKEEDVINDFEDLLIMANCKHSIIINSTYHWWGARLNDNKDKIVVAPKTWFFDNKPIDIIPSNWSQI